jgi:leader peptidase (prepilin peptidase)/N-methyltransferase
MELSSPIVTLCFIFGAIIGSFLGVCAYRIPVGTYEPVREGIPVPKHPVSIRKPARSFCPRCEHQLRWYHTIPIVSWCVLKGRCAFCKEKIPFRYCLLEVTTGLFAALSVLRFGLTPTALCIFVVVCALLVITVIDLDYMIIPDLITYPGTALGILLGVASSYFPLQGFIPLEPPFISSLAGSVLGIVFGAGLLYSIWWFYLVVRKREGLGLGDVKLLAMLGAMFGYQCSLATIFIGSILGSVVGICLMLWKRHSLTSYISFGPYLVIAAIAYLFNFEDLIAHLHTPSNPSVWRVFK